MTENCNEDYKLINNFKNGLSPKINYNQYKHLIDVFTTGDFLIESLDKSVGLVTYRRLMTEDNILYFTQNTKRTCNVPLGVNKKNKELKMIDLMNRPFCYRHSNVDVLNNFVKLTMCYLMQKYKPDEYEVYYDLSIKELEGLESFHFIHSTKYLDDIFTTISDERHRKYFDCGVYTYKEFRKSNSEKLIVIISTNPNNINLLNKIGSNSLRDGIAIIKLEQSDISNSSTISLDNTIRPNISEEDLKTEVEIYKRMLGEYNNMINQINLLTGEILNEGDLHENLLVKLPMDLNTVRFKNKLEEKLENTDIAENERNHIEKTIAALVEESNSSKFAIYNMREYGYQFGGINANGDCGSFYHHLLKYRNSLDEESLRYIIGGSVYTLFSHSSPKLQMALRGQKDLSDSDKKILDNYVERQVKRYKGFESWFDVNEFDADCDDYEVTNKVFYETYFCKIELKDKRLFVTMNGKEKKLPEHLMTLINLDKLSINIDLLELIVRYELYLEYGVRIPSDIYDSFWYTDNSYVDSHKVKENGSTNRNSEISKSSVFNN